MKTKNTPLPVYTSPEAEGAVPEVLPEDLFKNLESAHLVDVREPFEWVSELGHIEGSDLITLGPDLESFFKEADPTKTYVLVCRSGARSGRATLYAQSLGFEKTYNLRGGMILWNEKNFPTKKEV